MQVKSDPGVAEVIGSYPAEVQKRLRELRELIIETAAGLDIEELEETLKWGEPSYLTKRGSTIRIDWKERSADEFAMYFKCTSQLVETFRTVYPDTFTYDKNRAIVFALDEPVPSELADCIAAALRYHQVKKLDQLGLNSGPA